MHNLKFLLQEFGGTQGVELVTGEAMTLSPYRETFCNIRVQVSSVALYLDFFLSLLYQAFFSLLIFLS